MTRRSTVLTYLGAALFAALSFLGGCSSETKPAPKPATPPVTTPPPAPTPVPPKPTPPPENLPPVMLGIDVLEADGFKAIAGKRIGLLTHAAGVNRRGESTINVLRRAPQS